MAGYSNTPLLKKLGIKEGFRLSLINPPEGFDQELGALPRNAVQLAGTAKQLDFIMLFSKSEQLLKARFSKLANKLQPSGMIWVSWPKKSSGVATDLTEGEVRRIGLAAGLVDVKICAVNEIWSGLKFVYRLRDRPKIR